MIVCIRSETVETNRQPTPHMRSGVALAGLSYAVWVLNVARTSAFYRSMTFLDTEEINYSDMLLCIYFFFSHGNFLQRYRTNIS